MAKLRVTSKLLVVAVLPLQRTTQLTSRNAANQNNQASYTAVAEFLPAANRLSAGLLTRTLQQTTFQAICSSKLPLVLRPALHAKSQRSRE